MNAPTAHRSPAGFSLNEQQARRVLIGIILLTILVRLVYSFGVERWLLGLAPEEGATDDYHLIAETLFNGQGYRYSEAGEPTMRRAPLYPLFIYTIFKISGINYVAVQIAQALLAGLSCLFLFLLGRWLLSSTLGLTAALMFALYPNAIEYSARLYGENVYLPLFLGFAYFLCRASLRGSIGYGFSAGIAWGLGLLTRGTLLYLPLALPIGLLLSRAHRGSIKQVLRWAVPMLLAGALVISPWVIRNYQLSSHIVPVSTWTWSPLYQGTQVSKHVTEWQNLNAVDRDAHREVRQHYRAHVAERDVEVSSHPEVDYDRFVRSKTFEDWSSDPVGFVFRSIRGIAFAWFLAYDPKMRAVSLAIHAPLIILFVWGAIAMFRRYPNSFEKAWPALALILFVNVLQAVAYPHVRFMAPATVLSFVFSSILLMPLMDRLLARTQQHGSR